MPEDKSIASQPGVKDITIREDILVNVYHTFVEDTHELRNERLQNNSLRLSIMTIFLAAQGYLAEVFISEFQNKTISSDNFSSIAPIILLVLVGVIGFWFCNIWRNFEKRLSDTLGKKYEHLVKFENTYPELKKNFGVDLFSFEAERYSPVSNDNTPIKTRSARPEATSRSITSLQTFFQILFILIGLIPLGIKTVFIIFNLSS